MALYALSFRLASKTAGGKTYQERYDQLIENVRAEGKGFWSEPTSFFMVQSDLSTPAFVKAASQGLSAPDDLVFAFDPADMSAAYFGSVEEAGVLRSFFPRLMKVE